MQMPRRLGMGGWEGVLAVLYEQPSASLAFWLPAIPKAACATGNRR